MNLPRYNRQMTRLSARFFSLFFASAAVLCGALLSTRTHAMPASPILPKPAPVAELAAPPPAPIAANTAAAQASPTDTAIKRPKIGLVLSGGGARGAAHVGVIKILEELQIPIDYIAGTSMGALVGAAYASGTPINELERRLASVDWNDLFTDTSPRADRSFLRKEEDQAHLLKLEIGVKEGALRLPPGAISGQKLDTLFSIITRNSSGFNEFDQLPIPFRAIATDAETGRMVVFKRGRLPDVMRASMSVPGAIAPFTIGDKIYLDGGLTRNLPVDIVREMGADIVIAVNIAGPLLKRDELQSIFGVTLQMINILTDQNVRVSIESLKKGDILISPPLDTIGATDFNFAADAMTIGAAATREIADTLKRLSRPAQFAAFRETQLRHIQTPLTLSSKIDDIRVAGLVRANEGELKRTLGIKPGDPLDFKRINDGISRVFGTGYFERVNYSIITEGTGGSERQILTVSAREKQWGPNYLRFALSMASDTTGEGRFNLLLRYQQTQFNKAGAEWRNDLQIGRDRRFASSFFQPFGIGSIANISAGVDFSRRPIDIFSSGRRIAQYDVATSAIGFDLGLDFGRSTIARLGVVRGNDSADVSIGSLSLPNGKQKQGGIKLRVLFDSLDDANFPRAGSTASFDYYASSKALSATNDYRKAEINFSDHYSFGDHTISYAGRYGKIFGAKQPIPIFDQFSLGGFLQLSGYLPGELIGESVAMGRVSYYQRIGNSSNSLGRNIYGGFSTELGRVSQNFQTLSNNNTKYSVGLFVGMDTFLGPLYMGYGRSREHSNILYFFLGQP